MVFPPSKLLSYKTAYSSSAICKEAQGIVHLCNSNPATSHETRLVCSSARPLLNEAAEEARRAPLPVIADYVAMVLSS